eukprot:4496709-Amphidinium_carterae.1
MAASLVSRSDAFFQKLDDDPSCPRFVPQLSPASPPGCQWPSPDFEVVQNAGEMLVFPGEWWHQVYHCSATAGLASQYCSRRTLPRSLIHILAWCGIPVHAAQQYVDRLLATKAP